MLLALELLRLDGGTQPRAAMNLDVIEDYANHLTDGAKFPPVTAFYDGTEYWLADGFHRFQAHRQNGALKIEADIKQGSRRDAVLHSVGANSSHGLRRTNADKRRAVMVLLEDAEGWAEWSNREIARRCGVGSPFVATLRPDISVIGLQIERKVERNGTTYIQNTANIGKAKPQQTEPPESQQPVIAPSVAQITPSAPRVKYVGMAYLEAEPSPLERINAKLAAPTHEVFVRDEEDEPEETLIPIEVANAGMRVSAPENTMTRMVDALAPAINDQQVDGFSKALDKLLEYRDIMEELRQRPRYKFLGIATLCRLAAEMLTVPTPDFYPSPKTIDLEVPV